MSTPAEHGHHIVRPMIYFRILIILLILTFTTWGVAFINLGVFNPVVALAIACIKVGLVVLFFMHMRYSSKLLKLTLFSGIFAYTVLVVLTLSDYISRAWGMW